MKIKLKDIISSTDKEQLLSGSLIILKEIQLNTKNAAKINGGINKGTFTVGDIVYDYTVTDYPPDIVLPGDKDQIRLSGKIARGKPLKNAPEKGPSDRTAVRSSSQSAHRTTFPQRGCRHWNDDRRPHRRVGGSLAVTVFKPQRRAHPKSGPRRRDRGKRVVAVGVARGEARTT